MITTAAKFVLSLSEWNEFFLAAKIAATNFQCAIRSNKKEMPSNCSNNLLLMYIFINMDVRVCNVYREFDF